MSNINIPTQVSPFSNFAQFPTVGKIRVIYIDKATNTAYYWNDTTTTYVSLGGASSVDWGSIGGDILDQTDLQNALSGKVDKVTGKGLSTNDYTTAEKNKLAGIQAGAEVNVNADWNATTGDAVILNKPTIPDVSGLATTVYVDAQDALKMDKSVYDPTESGRVNTARWVEIDVLNNTGASIPKMSVVYFKTSSSSADVPEILLANANSEATSSKTMGLTKDVIANGASGKVILEGEYNLFNTSAYSVGARLWLSTTSGQITTTAPTPPNHAVFIGIVSRSQTTNGRICIKIQNGYELDELHDVTTTNYSTPQDVDSLLILDNSTSLWKRLTWANLKATAKTYFDTIYQTIIPAGTTSQYFRGDKTFQTLDKTAVGLSNVDNTSDANKPVSTAQATAINAKQNTLVSGTNIKTINGSSVLGSGDLTISGGISSINTFSPLASTGGSTPTLSISEASTSADGYLNSSDWNTFNGKQDGLISGTNIKTINFSTLLTSGNINLVAGLSGTTPINTSILTGGIGSISIDQATTSSNGYLNSTDWNTFNGKQAPLVSGTNIKTINGSSVLGSGDLTISGGGGGGVHFNTKPISGQYFSGQLVNGAGGANQSTIANRMTFIPVIPKTTFTASNFAINVLTGSAGSLAKILIYSDLNGYPSSKLYESTNLDCSTIGLKTVTASSFVFNANTIYWVGSIHNQAGAQFTGFASGSCLPLGVGSPGSTMNFFVGTTNFAFVTPPPGPIPATGVWSLLSNGHAGVFIQAL